MNDLVLSAYHVLKAAKTFIKTQKVADCFNQTTFCKPMPVTSPGE